MLTHIRLDGQQGRCHFQKSAAGISEAIFTAAQLERVLLTGLGPEGVRELPLLAQHRGTIWLLFIACCIVHCTLTIASRLDVMNRLGRAMADPTRSRILLMLLAGPGYPAIISRELGLSRSNVSNHLACLRDCGIVVAQPEGRKTRYEIADPHLTRALSGLLDTTLAVDDGAQCIDPSCPVEGCCERGSH